MKVTFLEGKDWEAEMGSKEGTFGEQYELAMGYKMCSRNGWIGPYLRQMMLVGILMDVHKE